MTTLMTAFDGVQVPTRQDPANFPARGDDMMSRFPPFQTQINTITQEVNTNTLSAADSAAQALASSNAAVAVSNTVKWVSGTVYNDGQVVWSPLTKLSYRRSGTGSGTTDPSQDSVNYTLVTPVSGFGGVVAPTGNQTLTKDSAGAQSITPTGYGQAVTLPNATTCNEAALVFSVKNTGPYPYGIKDAGGNYLGWVPPRETVLIGLADNTTSNGAWQLFGADPAAVTAVTTLASLDLATFDAITVDANRTFLLLGASLALYGMVLDSSTGLFGAPTLIRAPGSAVNFAYAVATATAGQVLVASCNSTNALEVVALTLTGTSIALGTPATATLAGTATQTGGGFVALGTNYLIKYGRATSVVGLRNVTVSGTTPSISAETAVTNATTAASLFAANATTAMSFDYSGANHYATPVTISAGVPALGTQTSWANANALEMVRAFGSRWLTFSAGNMGLVSLAGTVASNTTFAGGLTAGDGTNGYVADGQISATKWFYALSNSTTVRIVTDTAGTASVASATFNGLGQTTPSGMLLGKINSSRAFLYSLEQGNAISGSQNNYQNFKVVEVDVSGATPSIVKQVLIEAPFVFQGPTADASLYIQGTLPFPGFNYRGLISLQAGTPAIATSQGVQRQSGSPQVLGVDAGASVIVGGLSSLVGDGGSLVPQQIRSLQMAPSRTSNNSAWFKALNGMHVNSRKIIGQGGALASQRTFFAMECAA